MKIESLRVENLKNNNGNKAVNQFVIICYDEKKAIENIVFQSYDTVIASYSLKNGELKLDINSWDCTTTTLRYLKKFLEDYTSIPYETKAKFDKFIRESYIIELIDLN